MMARSGFTLFELLVAIVLAGVVALLAYGTARAGIDTSERLERHRTAVEAQAIVRALLLDALRHPPEGGGAAMNDLLFTIDDAMDGTGLPTDGVHFFSRGISAPLGTAAEWSVTLTPTEAGLRLLAVPAQAGPAPIDMVLPGARGLDARVLSRSADSTWLERWDVPGRVPAAVALQFLSETGTPVAPALVVHAALEVVR
jgi:prepilin-type N-terminal cleavage/methylation domain-containing protein